MYPVEQIQHGLADIAHGGDDGDADAGRHQGVFNGGGTVGVSDEGYSKSRNIGTSGTSAGGIG